jgi:hypothetical protein
MNLTTARAKTHVNLLITYQLTKGFLEYQLTKVNQGQEWNSKRNITIESPGEVCIYIHNKRINDEYCLKKDLLDGFKCQTIKTRHLY